MKFLCLHKKANYPDLFLCKMGLCVLCLGLYLPISTAKVSAQANSCPNLVTDGSFESGRGWKIESNGNYSVFSDVQAHSGSQSAYLAGMDHAEDLLSTTVNLPEGEPSLTFHFWWKVNSEDTHDANDELQVQVADSNGKLRKTLFTFGSNHASNRWHQSSADLSQFAGQTIRLQFAAETDGASITDFFIDDVEITTCGD